LVLTVTYNNVNVLCILFADSVKYSQTHILNIAYNIGYCQPIYK